MKQISLSEMEEGLSKYLRMAETEDIVITRDGKPVGYLVGFEDEDDWIDYLMLRDPKFQDRMHRSLQDAKEGRVIAFEALKSKSNSELEAEYRLDYSKARPNRFAERRAEESTLTVTLEPDHCCCVQNTRSRQSSFKGARRDDAKDLAMISCTIFVSSVGVGGKRKI